MEYSDLSVLHRIECRDSADLLAKLDPSSTLWTPFRFGRWAFRGQADATWDLVPRAMREGQQLSFTNPAIRAPLQSSSQIAAEFRLLVNFVELADELGFPLPGGIGAFSLPWAQHEGPVFLNQPWPPSHLLEIVAIAQHHGVPTRLLDFTFNPLVAAYFAASDQGRQSGRVAVWAVDVEFVQRGWAAFVAGVRVVQVSRAHNPFLHAQSGLFLYDASGTSSSLRQSILNYDLELATHVTQSEKEELAASPRVLCLTMPSDHRAALLERLFSLRITNAHLRPTLDNVVQQLWANSRP
jgi:hypothetical protein